MLKAIKIDSERQELSVVNVPNGLESIYKLIGCSMIESATYIGNDCVYVDEEGIFNNRGMIAFAFEVKGGHQPFLGNGLVVGTDAEGNTISPEITIEQLRPMISFRRIAGGEVF
jgi:hypothetical protein